MYAQSFLVCIALIAFLAGRVTAQPTLPLDWADARALQDLGVAEAPAGCRCLEDSRPCAAFECTCTCDMQAGVCDPGCCCDSDCPSDVTFASQRLGDCLPQGAENSSLLTCVSVADRASDGSSVFAEINARRGLAVTPADEGLAQGATADGSLSRLMCVAVVNSPSLGFYYDDPGPQPASAFARSEIEEDPQLAAADGADAGPLGPGSPSVLQAASATAAYAPGQPLTGGVLPWASIGSSADTSLLAAPEPHAPLRLLGPAADGAAAPGLAEAASASSRGFAAAANSPVSGALGAAAAACSASGSGPQFMVDSPGGDGPAAGGAQGAGQCVVRAPPSAELCAALSPAALVGALRVGASPRANPRSATASASALLLAPSVVSWSRRDAATGEALPALSAAQQQAALALAPASAGGFDGCSCAGASVTALHLAFRYETADGEDEGAGGGTVVAVEASIETTEGARPGRCPGEAGGGGARGAAPGAVQLPFAVSWRFVPRLAEGTTDDGQLQTAPDAAGDDSGSPRQRFGHPGYRPGGGIAAARGVVQTGAESGEDGATDAAGMLAFRAGLQVLAPGEGGLCLGVRGGVTSWTGAQSAGGADAWPSSGWLSASSFGAQQEQLPVPFGEDAVVSCGLRLDAGALETLCGEAAAALAGAPSAGQTSFRPSADAVTVAEVVDAAGAVAGAVRALFPPLAINATHVGIYGSADPRQPLDWLPLLVDPLPDASAVAWDAASRTCAGLPAVARLRLLSAQVGERASPQRRLLAARLTYESRDWAAPLGVAGEGPGLPDPVPRTGGSASTAASLPASRTYQLRLVVEHSEQGPQSSFEFIPPSPRTLRLPHDLFYPFEVEDVQSTGARRLMEDRSSSGANPGSISTVLAAVHVSVVALLGLSFVRGLQ